eukprot:scaffold10399_cov94-Isochrysis_galbana.AAC.1
MYISKKAATVCSGARSNVAGRGSRVQPAPRYGSPVPVEWTRPMPGPKAAWASGSRRCCDAGERASELPCCARAGLLGAARGRGAHKCSFLAAPFDLEAAHHRDLLDRSDHIVLVALPAGQQNNARADGLQKFRREYVELVQLEAVEELAERVHDADGQSVQSHKGREHKVDHVEAGHVTGVLDGREVAACTHGRAVRLDAVLAPFCRERA